jgi:hypothetical protein
MTRMIRDAKFRMNDGGKAAARPERPSEAIGFGALLQQGRQAGEWVGGQAPRGTGTWAVAEGHRDVGGGRGAPGRGRWQRAAGPPSRPRFIH